MKIYPAIVLCSKVKIIKFFVNVTIIKPVPALRVKSLSPRWRGFAIRARTIDPKDYICITAIFWEGGVNRISPLVRICNPRPADIGFAIRARTIDPKDYFCITAIFRE